MSEQSTQPELHSAIRIAYFLQLLSYIVLPVLGPLVSMIWMYSVRDSAASNPLYASHVNNIISTTWKVFIGYIIATILIFTVILSIIGGPLAFIIYIWSLIKFIRGFLAFESGRTV